MRLTVIGCSPAWPNPGGAQSGYRVEAGGTRILLDCGPGVLSRLREEAPWPELDGIVISHFHLDHFGDLVPWVWGTIFRSDDRTAPPLWLPPGGREVLADIGSRLGSADMFEQVFAIHEYASRERFGIGALELEPVPVLHYDRPTHGFRVEAGGTTLAYSADTGPAPALGELAREADLLLCEATLLDGAGDGPPRGHLSAAEALEVAQEAGVRRLLLTHRPAELPGVPEAELAHDGLELEL